MIDFEQLPLWVMVASMLVLAVLGAGGLGMLMRTRAQRLRVCVWVPTGSAIFVILMATLKRNSFYHAMLLYDDVMLLLLCLVLGMLPEVVRVRREAARTGNAPAPLSEKAGARAAWIAVGGLFIILAVEYVVAAHHRL